MPYLPFLSDLWLLALNPGKCSPYVLSHSAGKEGNSAHYFCHPVKPHWSNGTRWGEVGKASPARPPSRPKPSFPLFCMHGVCCRNHPCPTRLIYAESSGSQAGDNNSRLQRSPTRQMTPWSFVLLSHSLSFSPLLLCFSTQLAFFHVKVIMGQKIFLRMSSGFNFYCTVHL